MCSEVRFSVFYFPLGGAASLPGDVRDEPGLRRQQECVCGIQGPKSGARGCMILGAAGMVGY